jgi:DNA polymerase-3 subunit beta
MKFSAAVRDLAQALGRISSATPQRSPMPVLENLLLQLEGSTLTLTATDMDITMATRLDVRGDRDGALLIPAKRLTDTVKAFEQGECVFDADPTSRRVTIQTGTGEYRLTGLDAADFPQVAKFEPRISIALSQATFAEMVERTVFAVSSDEFRPAMTGVLFQFRPEEIRAVATDGFRLVRVIDRQTPADVTEPLDIIVPPKALQLAARSVNNSEITSAARSC